MTKNSLNVRSYNNKEGLLFPSSVGDYLPKEHLAHIVDEAVDEIDLERFYRKISVVGNPAYHPALMVKIWFYGYATRVYSSRRIEEKLNTDIAFIYLAGMQKPDFRTISDFRKNNLEGLREAFVDIVQICHRLGLTKLGEIAIDSKIMKANASKERTYDEEGLKKEREVIENAIKEYLEEANRIDAEEDEKYGTDKNGKEVPKEISDKGKRIKKLKKIAQELKEAQDKLKSSGQKKVNLTDGDAPFQKDKGRIISGYRAQLAVDSKEQVIMANDVTNEQNDARQLVPMVDEVLNNVKELEPEKFSQREDDNKPIKILADGSYGSGKNFNELEKSGYERRIEPYVKDTGCSKYNNPDSPFHMSKFIYDEKSNSFICPDGKKLRYIGKRSNGKLADKGELQDVYQSRARNCVSCRYFGVCTTNKQGRRVWISKHYRLTEKMRQKLSTGDGRKIYGIRKITVEPVIGNLSWNLGFREFMLRGIKKVRGEFSLMCIAHNLLKIAKNVREMGINLKEALKIAKFSLLPDTS